MTTATTQKASLLQLWPLLSVQNLDRSLTFYRDQLGFSIAQAAKDAAGKIFWCRLERDGCSLMLQQDEAEDGPAEGRGRGIGFYFICDDTDALHAELTQRGLKLDPPTTACYGMKQLFIPEPDGYSLCFETPTTNP